PSRGQMRAPGAQQPSQGSDLGEPRSAMDLQLLENKALSWSTIRKPACLLATITIRKSQNISPILPGSDWAYPPICNELQCRFVVGLSPGIFRPSGSYCGAVAWSRTPPPGETVVARASGPSLDPLGWA